MEPMQAGEVDMSERRDAPPYDGKCATLVQATVLLTVSQGAPQAQAQSSGRHRTPPRLGRTAASYHVPRLHLRYPMSEPSHPRHTLFPPSPRATKCG